MSGPGAGMGGLEIGPLAFSSPVLAPGANMAFPGPGGASTAFPNTQFPLNPAAAASAGSGQPGQPGSGMQDALQDAAAREQDRMADRAARLAGRQQPATPPAPTPGGNRGPMKEP